MYTYIKETQTLVFNTNRDIFSFYLTHEDNMSVKHLIYNETEYIGPTQLARMLLDLKLEDLIDIKVCINNPYYTSIDGIVYTKDGKIPVNRIGYTKGERTLVFCPVGKSHVKIPEGVEVIGRNAFTSVRLSTVIIPDSVKKINTAAFTDCKYLSDVELGSQSQLTFIGDSAFNHCISLEKFTMPESLETLSDRAFARSSIKEITFPKNLIDIGECIFAESGLQRIHIPKSHSQKIDCIEIIKSCIDTDEEYPDNNSGNPSSSVLTIHIENLTPIVVPRYVYSDDIDELQDAICKFIKTNSTENLVLYKYGSNLISKEDTALEEYKLYASQQARRFLIRNVEHIAKRKAKEGEEQMLELVKLNIWGKTSLQKLLKIAEDMKYIAVISYLLDKIPKKKTTKMKL